MCSPCTKLRIAVIFVKNAETFVSSAVPETSRIAGKRVTTRPLRPAKFRVSFLRRQPSLVVVRSSASAWWPNVRSCAYSANILLRRNVKIILQPNLRLRPFYIRLWSKVIQRQYTLYHIHCNLVITLILGAKRNEHYNETSVIMKCTL